MATTKQATLDAGGHKNANGNAASYRNGSVKGASKIENEATDIQHWRLLDERGRQTWHYLDSDEKAKAWPQTTADRYFLGLDLVGKSPSPHEPQGIG